VPWRWTSTAGLPSGCTASRGGQSQFVPWQAVYDQFGQGYREIRKFRRDFIGILVQVKAAYPAARLGYDPKGLTLEASPPPVPKRLVQVIHSDAAAITGSIADS
jgi:hypothetical protein